MEALQPHDEHLLQENQVYLSGKTLSRCSLPHALVSCCSRGNGEKLHRERLYRSRNSFGGATINSRQRQESMFVSSPVTIRL